MNQIYCFIIFIVVGIIISILFDIFRILRKVFKTPDFITYIEDIIFGVFSGIIIIYSIFIFNNGEIRLYLFLGILLGILSYLCTLSKLFIKFGDKIFTFFKKILLFPIKKALLFSKNVLKFINRNIFRPFSKFINNLRNKISKFSIKKCKNRRKKEGF